MKKRTIYVALALALSGMVAIYLVTNSVGEAKMALSAEQKDSSLEGEKTSAGMAASPQSGMSSPSEAMKSSAAPTMSITAPATITLPGEIVADKRSEIYAKVLSYVKSIRVDIGSKVKKGDLLMELEAPELTAQLASLQAKVYSLQAEVKLSNSHYERVLRASQVEGSVSQFALDEALAQMDSNQSLLAAAQASYEQVKSMTDYLTVRAPFAGLITRRTTDVGSLVGAASNGQKEPLLVLQESEKLRIQLAINEKYASLVSVGDTLQFTVRSLGGELFKAVVSRKAGALDSRLRAEQVEADFENQSGRLLPGMVGDVVVKLGE